MDEIGSQFGQNDLGDRCVDDDTVGDKNSSQSSKDSLPDADPSPHKEELYERHKTAIPRKSSPVHPATASSNEKHSRGTSARGTCCEEGEGV